MPRLIPILLLLSATTVSAAIYAPSDPLTTNDRAPFQETEPRIAMTSSSTVAIWNHDGLVRSGATTSGSPISEAQQFTLGNQASDLRLVTSGDRALAVLIDSDIRVAPLDPAGAPLVAPYTIGFRNAPFGPVAAAAGSERFLIVFTDAAGLVNLALIDRNGSLITWPRAITSDSTDAIASLAATSVLSKNGEAFVVAWTTLGQKVFTFVVTNSGVSSKPVPLPDEAREVALAARVGGAFLVETTSGGLRGRLLTPGAMVNSEQLVLTNSNDYGPLVAWDGSGWDVVFSRDTHFHQYEVVVATGIRLNAEGAFSDSIGLDAGAAVYPGMFAIAAGEQRLEVVYSAWRALRAHVTLGEPATPPRRRGTGH